MKARRKLAREGNYIITRDSRVLPRNLDNTLPAIAVAANIKVCGRARVGSPRRYFSRAKLPRPRDNFVKAARTRYTTCDVPHGAAYRDVTIGWLEENRVPRALPRRELVPSGGVCVSLQCVKSSLSLSLSSPAATIPGRRSLANRSER